MATPVLQRVPRLASRSCQQQQRLVSARGFTTTSARRKEIEDAYILSASRTPVGTFNGAFSTVSATQLGAIAIQDALAKSKVLAEHIEHVYMGQVLQAGVGQAPARQAAIFAGLPSTIDATTVNKVCSSGLKSVTLGAQQIQLGQASAVVAGGMESMTRVPYYLPRSSQLAPFGNMTVKDGLIEDGLWDVYNQFHMGSCAENTAKKHGITRESQDEYAARSYRRAQEAWKAGLFDEEVVPVSVKGRKGGRDAATQVTRDEQVDKIKPDKLATLKPVFDRSGTGTITAANSSPLSDGASALVLAGRGLARDLGGASRVLARVVAYADAAVDPLDFPVAPAKVVPVLLRRAGLAQSDVAVWEFNEAFAAVIRANAKILGLDDGGGGGGARVNERGGAIALGHALGSSGSRILTTLLHQLGDGEFGVAAICNGGGGATGIVVQKIAPSDI